MIQQPADLVSVDTIRLIHLPSHSDISGRLIVMEGMVNVPFNISRAFTIIAPPGALRGQHAHRACSQFLTCPSGSIEVFCDDGDQTRVFVLDRPDLGLYLPASIWIRKRYLTDHTVLNVLCDLPYDDSDYIRDYQEFKNYRAQRQRPDNN